LATDEPLETLSVRRLNRALLARQHLLEPAAAGTPLTQVIEDVGGLQTQYAPSAYYSLFTRMARFERAYLTRAMEARQVIHGTLMRATIHSVSARDYWPIVAGIRRARQEWIKRVSGGRVEDVDFAAAGDALRDVLREGPLSARDVTRLMAERGFPRESVGRGSMWADIVRIPPSGTWERRANDLYELAEHWLPPETQPGGMPDEADGIKLLLGRYLRAFGPARVADFANWAGLPPPSAALAARGMLLLRFRDEARRVLVDLPDAPLPPEDTPAPVRFLPVWDATLLVHARATQILPEAYRPLIFTRTPQSVPCFIVDGQVAGTWRYDSGAVVTDAFAALPAALRRAVDAEAARLTQFHTR